MVMFSSAHHECILESGGVSAHISNLGYQIEVSV